MTEHPHPILKAEVHVFVGVDKAKGKCVARMYPYDTYPILFFGSSQYEVEQQARDFIVDVVAKNQKAYSNRKAAAERLKEARKKKKNV